jgi:serine/threonine protein kinase
MTKASQILIPYLSMRPLRVVARHEGGFGHILIVQGDDGEKHALKTLKADLGIDRSALAAEASILVDLPPHTNVIQIEGIVCYEGEPCIVLPAMHGNLRDLLRQHPFSPDAAVGVLNHVASGLAHLHGRAGILHLDLMPENILVAGDNRYVISDFGLSAFLPSPQDLRARPELVTSNVVGTVAYMSPEHFITKRLTPKTDVFSFGIIFFELLAGRHPFEALTLQDIASRILNEIPSFSAPERARIPSSLRAMCLACLEKNAANRPSATDIIETLGTTQQYAPKEQTGIGDIAHLVNRANTLTQLGRAEEAQRLLDQGLAENPWYLPAVTSRAEIEYAKGNVQQAAEMAETATTIALWISPPPPGLGTLLVDLASYYLSLDPEQAIRYARLAVKLDPEDWQALGNLAEGCRVFGQARNKQDLLDEGLAAVQEALSKAPRDLKLLITYGGILLAKKDLQTLCPFVIRLVNEFGGDDVLLRLLLIRTFIATGQLRDAEAWLAPMRAYPPLQPIVEMAEQEMSKRRQDLGIA